MDNIIAIVPQAVRAVEDGGELWGVLVFWPVPVLMIQGERKKSALDTSFNNSFLISIDRFSCCLIFAEQQENGAEGGTEGRKLTGWYPVYPHSSLNAVS